MRLSLASVVSALTMALLGAGALAAPAPAAAQQAKASSAAPSGEPWIQRGTRRCQQGEWHLAVDELGQALALAATPGQRARAAAALALALHRRGQLDEAETLLLQAYEAAGDAGVAIEAAERATWANDLGNLALARSREAEARRWYGQAQRLAPQARSLQTSVALNLARLEPAAGRLERLQRIDADLAAIDDEADRARYAAQLGAQAVGLGAAGTALAHASFQNARRLAAAAGAARTEAQAVAGLAGLYEDAGRGAEALLFVDEAVRLAQALDARDLLLRLEWQRGRLLRAAGRPEAAVAAYRRAVEHIEAIRQDIPIVYEGGRSSFREALEPIYLGLADLLLAQSATQPADAARQATREARDVVEQIKRSELEDYLGDRCTVESARTLQAAALPAGTAVLYPILLPGRLELLVETAQGLQRQVQPVPAAELQALALDFAGRLREKLPYVAQARLLYERLLRPIEAFLAEQQTDTLVVVPDGVLRLVPFGALLDGNRFAIEKLAVVTAPALSLTATGAAPRGPSRRLVAGLSEPGPVIDTLPPGLLGELGLAMTAGPPEREALRRSLRLPGVKSELQALGAAAGGATLLDADFTVSRFESLLSSGDFGFVHIASHGVFSSSAAASWVMAYDGLITLDRLQGSLGAERLRERPLELLTLSACQTAEGDDRAPLGLSGAALKARARSALGSLWPVSDEVTPVLMAAFYERLAQRQTSKARALQEVQRAFLAQAAFRHPYYWAAFILVGNWQ